MRNIEYLNYDWLFIKDKNDYLKGNNKNQEIVDIPHTNEIFPLNNFDERKYQLESLYLKKVQIKAKENCHYFLIFEGIAHQSDIYINGIKKVHCNCGYLPIKIDITDYVAAEFEIKVFVNAKEEIVPPFGGTIDYLTFGGIYRSVYIEELPQNYIRNFYISSSSILEGKAVIEVNLFGEGNILLEIGDIYKEEIYVDNFLKKEIFLSPILWDVDNPKMYKIKVSFKEDILEFNYGFKTSVFRSDGFYLNDKRLSLRGLDRHQSFPYVGYAMPKSMQRNDAVILKKMGCNVVRTSHYPQSKDFLDACDCLGLLVFEEIPGWQYIGIDSWKDIAVNNVKEMILRDRNHVSIILWGVRINESMDSHDFYLKTNEIAHLLDDRQTGGVRCFGHSELLEDVYTFNDFALNNKEEVLKDKVLITTKESPLLITEFCGHMFPSKPFDDENHLTKQALIHASALDKVANSDCSGLIGWCMFDYNTHADFGSGDKVCYHGVLDAFRNPKPASYAYKVYSNDDVLYLTSSLNGGEYKESNIPPFIIFSNQEYVRIYRNKMLIGEYLIPPRGYIIIDDLVGQILIDVMHYNDKQIMNYKEIIKLMDSYKDIDLIPPQLRLDYTDDMIKEAISIRGKYVSGWGERKALYEIIGYRNGLEVKKIERGFEYLESCAVTCTADTLYTEESYDVVAITIKAMSNLHNVLKYAMDSFAISVSTNLSILGSEIISMVGGYATFYVRSKAYEGIGNVCIKGNNGFFKSIELTMRRK